MNKIYLMILMCWASLCAAENICSEWDNPIEEDMRIPESEFNLDNYEKAKRKLETLDPDSKDIIVEFAIENYSRMVQGYELRKKAIEHNSPEAIGEFCKFYASEAFYND